MKPRICIRHAEPRDIAQLLQLIADHALYERASIDPANTEFRLAAQLQSRSPRLLAWLAVDEDDRAHGYATATIDFSTWTALPYLHMDCLYVKEGSRSSGIGLFLLRTLQDYASASGIEEIQWQTPEWNHRARDFYIRAGATESVKLRFRFMPGPPRPAGIGRRCDGESASGRKPAGPDERATAPG